MSGRRKVELCNHVISMIVVQFSACRYEARFTRWMRCSDVLTECCYISTRLVRCVCKEIWVRVGSLVGIEYWCVKEVPCIFNEELGGRKDGNRYLEIDITALLLF